MKQKVSISIEEGNLLKIKELLKNPKFRSTSHVIEFSLDKFLKCPNSSCLLDCGKDCIWNSDHAQKPLCPRFLTEEESKDAGGNKKHFTN